MNIALVRRSFFIGAVAAVTSIGGALRFHASAQQAADGASQALNAETFTRLAHSSATLQLRAAELAASRDTRPEVRSFAQRMIEFRQAQIPRLERTAGDNKAAIPAVRQFEHQVVIENLEPLDFLALSRRYAELQVQALEQELLIYAGGEKGHDAWVKSLAGETTPELRQLLDGARAMRQAVGP